MNKQLGQGASDASQVMRQFRVQRNQYGNLWIDERVRAAYGYVWRNVCLRQLKQQTGEYE